MFGRHATLITSNPKNRAAGRGFKYTAGHSDELSCPSSCVQDEMGFCAFFTIGSITGKGEVAASVGASFKFYKKILGPRGGCSPLHIWPRGRDYVKDPPVQNVWNQTNPRDQAKVDPISKAQRFRFFLSRGPQGRWGRS